MTNYYAGIGARDTPSEVLHDMSRIASALADHGYWLRSGGANGADTAFETGCDNRKGRKEIFLPWSGFNDRHISEKGVYCLSSQYADQAKEIAAAAHPAWDRCSPGAKQMHSRNVAQILGPDLKTDSKFVVCWTKEGKGQGGTGQAIRIAKAKGIPVFDMGALTFEETCEQLCRTIEIVKE